MSKDRAHRAWRNAERIKRLSDKLISIGPFGIGLDGVLAWIPGAGPLYSVVAGGLLLVQAARARASLPTLLTMGGLLLADSAMEVVPVVGSAADMFFTGHKWSANLLLKHLDDTLYVEGAPDDPAHADVHARIRSGSERRRVVFLNDPFPPLRKPR